MRDVIIFLPISNKIKEYNSSIFNYGKETMKEKIKYEYITDLRKGYKLKINKLTEKINKYKN